MQEQRQEQGRQELELQLQQIQEGGLRGKGGVRGEGGMQGNRVCKRLGLSDSDVR
jgi:hypothetical protein